MTLISSPVRELFRTSARDPLSGSFRAFVDAAVTQLDVFITADIDNANPDERDDENAMALWLATQEHFNIVGLVANAPDSTVAQYAEVTTAYDADRLQLLTHSPFPSRYKSKTVLDDMRVQGATTDAPAAGFWTSGDAGYAAAHAAAQDLISAARTYGTASGDDPWKKLWVIVQGGFTTLAQAAYEAIELGELPDFFERICVLGQPNYNSWWADNAWNYLVSNSWSAAGVPGKFGDWWLLAGYFQWHAYNQIDTASATNLWNAVASFGQMGTFLDQERAASSFPGTNFRCGDGGAWFWLMSAKIQNNFDPENASNWCGAYRTYVGELWAAQTFGYGATSGINTGTPCPEHTWYNPHAWAPALTVNNDTSQAFAAVNMTRWFEVAEEVMKRYDVSAAVAATSHVTMPGGRTVMFKVTAGALSIVEGESVSFSLVWKGPATFSSATITFSEINPAQMSGTLADALAAISQTGVTASGDSLTVADTATSPATFTRTAASDGLTEADQSHTVEILSVSGGASLPEVVAAVGIFDDTPLVNQEATDFIARMTVQPSEARKHVIDQFFTDLKAIGLSKFDALYLLAAHDQQAALLNLISTSHNASAASAPTFTADRGFTTDGSSTYVDTTFNPTTSGVAYTQNSAHFAFWSLTTATISHNTPWGGANDDGAAPNTQMAPRTNSGNFSFRVNDGTTANTSSATSNGLAAVDRRTSSARRALLNGVAFAENSTASTGVPNAPFWLGRVSTVYSSRQFAFASVGGHLTDAEHVALHDAVSAYLTSVGAI